MLAATLFGLILLVALFVALVVGGLYLLVGERPRAARRAGAFAFGIIFAFLLILTGTARAHTAPSGWDYPSTCCSGRDCYPIAGTDIEAIGEGYRIRLTGELIAYADRRIRPSGDGHYHRCSTGGVPTAATLCLFLPAGT